MGKAGGMGDGAGSTGTRTEQISVSLIAPSSRSPLSSTEYNLS